MAENPSPRSQESGPQEGIVTFTTSPPSSNGNQNAPPASTKSWFALMAPWSDTTQVPVISPVDGSSR